MANPGPAIIATTNTQSPRSTGAFVQTIAVSITPTSIATASSVEQSYGANGATYATATTGILVGDVILGISPPSTAASCAIGGWRVDTSTNDKFYIDWVTSTTTITPPSGTYLITVLRMNLTNTNEQTPVSYSTFPSAITLN